MAFVIVVAPTGKHEYVLSNAVLTKDQVLLEMKTFFDNVNVNSDLVFNTSELDDRWNAEILSVTEVVKSGWIWSTKQNHTNVLYILRAMPVKLVDNTVEQLKQLNQVLTDSVVNQESVILINAERIQNLTSEIERRSTQTQTVSTQTDSETTTTTTEPATASPTELKEVVVDNLQFQYNYYTDNNLDRMFEFTYSESDLNAVKDAIGYAKHSFAPHFSFNTDFRDELKKKLKLPNYGLRQQRKRSKKFI
ncbi:hypothetical protein EB118_01925 [bacterium]|nr:hypothetical protein [bacterium]NDC94425.1 hypothetical protein [bacterium]NDD83007.1 hypothetical protein [bacterium]NDG28845.1 hypothetical protein [bacterium]